MPRLNELFRIAYGHNYELSRLSQVEGGIPFVSRSSRNNGITAYVEHTGESPSPAGCITVALGGCVLEAFVQPQPCYEGRDVAVLTPLNPMSTVVKLWYAQCIRANKFRFNYNRQANKELPQIEVPLPPESVIKAAMPTFLTEAQAAENGIFPPLKHERWGEVRVSDLFDIEVGDRMTSYEAGLVPGRVPFVAAAARNNSVVCRTSASAPHFLPGVLTFIGNGQGGVGLCFYQPEAFIASRDIIVLTPRFVMDERVGLFFASLLSRYRGIFNFGRKANSERVRELVIKVPMAAGHPDVRLIRKAVGVLPFSSVLKDPNPSALEAAKLLFDGTSVKVDDVPMKVRISAQQDRPALVHVSLRSGKSFMVSPSAVHGLVRGHLSIGVLRRTDGSSVTAEEWETARSH